MNDPSDKLAQIAELKARAQWYRQWAALASNEEERKGRLTLAANFDAQVHALLDAPEGS